MDAILFLHHHYLNEGATKRNLAQLKVFNSSPDIDIIPICFERRRGDGGWQWRNCDVLIYEWFKANNPRHDRFFIIEWDTFASCPLKEFYGAAYYRDAVGSSIIRPWSNERFPNPQPEQFFMQRDWPHFRELSSGALYPYLRGISPISGAMFSRQTLAAMVDLYFTDTDFANVFSECRLGTLAVKAAFEPQPIRPHCDAFISTEDVEIGGAPGLYHRVRI